MNRLLQCYLMSQVVLVSLLLSGCGPAVTPIPTISSEPIAAPTTSLAATATSDAKPPNPTATATATAKPAPSSTSTTAPTATTAPSATPLPQPTVTAVPIVIATPVLVMPGEGETVKNATFRWNGTLPSGYAYVVVAISDDQKARITSPPTIETSWVGDLPAAKSGGWQWSIQVIRQSDSRQMAISRPVHFYYTPIPGGGPGPYGQNLPVPPALVALVQDSTDVHAAAQLSVVLGLMATVSGAFLAGLARRRF